MFVSFARENKNRGESLRPITSVKAGRHTALHVIDSFAQKGRQNFLSGVLPRKQPITRRHTLAGHSDISLVSGIFKFVALYVYHLIIICKYYAASMAKVSLAQRA